MMRAFLAAFALAMTLGLAPTIAQAGQANAVFYDSKGHVVSDPGRDPMKNYYGNTYTCYWPKLWECHHWWNDDGTEVFFSVVWAPEGLVTLRTVDGLHDTFSANNQWCSHNARNVVAENGKAGAALERPDPNILNNNKNDCSPIVD